MVLINNHEDPGVKAIIKLKEFISERRETLGKEQVISNPDENASSLGWPYPSLIINENPASYSLPQEIFYVHTDSFLTHKRFSERNASENDGSRNSNSTKANGNSPSAMPFSNESDGVLSPAPSPSFNTSENVFLVPNHKELCIRQIFLHTPLTRQENEWLKTFRQAAQREDFEIPCLLEPLLLRIISFSFRYYQQRGEIDIPLECIGARYVDNTEKASTESNGEKGEVEKINEDEKVESEMGQDEEKNDNDRSATGGAEKCSSKASAGNFPNIADCVGCIGCVGCVWICEKTKKIADKVIAHSLNHAKEMIRWRINMLPLSDSTEHSLRQDIDKGICYWVGRNRYLLPLMIFNLSRMPKKMEIMRIKKLLIFSFEYALRYLLLPGIVETNIVLLDARGVPLLQLPIMFLSEIIQMLTQQYPFRLEKMLIIHDSYIISGVWSVACRFLTPVQQQKIKFYREKFQEYLLTEFNASQLEVKYGGIRPEVTSFYPYPMAPGPFQVGNTPLSEEIRKSTPLQNCWQAADDLTAFGISWEGKCRIPQQWTEKAFTLIQKADSLPHPHDLRSVALEHIAL